MNKKSRFWDRWARRYAKRPISDQETYQKKLDITRRYLSPGMQVLEFGCGTGSTALAHAPFSAHIRATDFSQKMIEIAQTKAETQGISNVCFEQAEIETLAAPDGSFDMVMGYSILHLLDNREEVIAKVFRLLKPGGVFVSSTACLDALGGALKFALMAGKKVGLLPPLQFFSEDDLAKIMTDAGFNIDHRWAPDQSKTVFLVVRKPL